MRGIKYSQKTIGGRIQHRVDYKVPGDSGVHTLTIESSNDEADAASKKASLIADARNIIEKVTEARSG